MKTASIQIISGPDQGLRHDLSSDVTRIGRGEENHLVLSDPEILEHHISIALKDGRYAIHSKKAGSVDIDGISLPPSEWVWLPNAVDVYLTSETSFHFLASNDTNLADDPDSNKSTSSTPTSVEFQNTDSVKKEQGRPSKKRKRKVARFRKEQSGEPLLKLGDDGQLPSLSLVKEGEKEKEATKSSSEQSPMLYGALAVSILFSMALLLMDFEVSNTIKEDAAQARTEIAIFHGQSGQSLLSYQKYLRQAQLAHSRKDAKAERQNLRRVLSLLNSENKNQFTGLTGTKADDEELQRLISTLLR